MGKEDDVIEYEELDKDELIEKITSIEENIQSKIDKRVTEAVQTTQEKMEKELAEERKKAKMSEEELREQERTEKEQAINERELKIALRESEIEIRDVIDEKGLDSSLKSFLHPDNYTELSNVEERKKAIEEDVTKLEEVFNSAVDSKVDVFKEEYLKGNTPPQLDDDTSLTDAYEKAKADKDARGMLKARMK